MRRFIIAVVLAAFTVAPATAAAHDKGSIQHKNSYLRAKVIKLSGDERTPGRDIVKYGVESKKDRYSAKWHDAVDEYFATLRRMIAPPPAPAPAPVSQTASAPAPVQSAAPVYSPGTGLEAIKQCESGGNYRAISPGGTYRGAYQFDYQTWQSVGGSGDPAAASPAEQDKRARILQSQRGNQPWPVCGS